MSTDSIAVIDEVFCKVLEKQAFLFPERMPAAELPQQSGNMFCASMGFSGSAGQKGEIDFYAPEAMCREIAANSLGVDADSPEAEEMAMDSLKEMLNMVCGNFLTSLAGQDVVFDLTVPTAVLVTKAEWDAVLARQDALCYCADDYAIVCVLKIQE